MKVKIGKLELKNPVIAASGTFGYGKEFHKNFYDISKLGAVATKGISLKPRNGNPTPRIIETPSGMLNAIGLQNVGVKAFIKEKLPFLKRANATVIANIFGERVEEYAELASILDKEEGVHAIELNISCPNVKAGGVAFGTDPKLAHKVVSAVRKAARKTLIVKLSPNFHDIPLMAKNVAGAGADAISLINTITGMAIDIKTKRPILANVTGGLSGPAIKPIALRMVWEAYNAVGKGKKGVPIIGIGGILNATDAIEFMLAGAKAVQIGTANFIKPSTALDIIEGLEKYNVKSFTGALKMPD